MPLLYHTNSYESVSEREMQDDVVDILDKMDLGCKILQEIHISAVGRISDIILYFGDRRIFNIELKLNNVQGVLNQALDHKEWANYSIVCMPSNTYIASRYVRKMVDEGIGLLIWQPGILIEPVLAKYFTHGKKDVFSAHSQALSFLKKCLKDNRVKGYPIDNIEINQTKMFP